MKKLILLIALALPFALSAQELDKTGHKFLQKAYYSFMKGESDKLTDMFIDVKLANQISDVSGGRIIEEEQHNQSVQRIIKRSLDARSDLGNDWSNILYDNAEVLESEDEEGLIFMEIKFFGTDGNKNYTLSTNKLVQFPNGKYYFTEDIELTITDQ